MGFDTSSNITLSEYSTAAAWSDGDRICQLDTFEAQNIKGA